MQKLTAMGVAYRNMGKPDEAIDAYKKAISIYPYYARLIII